MDLKEFGTLLKEERIRQGLELSEVMEKTKISRVSLEAIEEGNVRALPHPVYAKGFVKNYARFLGLDADKMGNTMAQIYTSDEDEYEDEQIALADARRLPAVSSHWPLHMGLLALLAVLTVIAVGGWYFRAPLQDAVFSLLEKTGILSRQQDPEGRPAPGSELGPAGAGVQRDKPWIAADPEGRTDSAPPAGLGVDEPADSGTGLNAGEKPAVSTTDEEAGESPAVSTTTEEEAGEVPALLPTGTGDGLGNKTEDGLGAGLGDGETAPSPLLKVDTPLSSAQESTPPPAPEPSVTHVQPEAPAVAATGVHSLEIKARRNCWLSTQADGGRVKEAFLRPDDRLVVTYEKTMELKLGNAGGVDLFLDGRPWPLRAKPGEVLVLRFP